MTTAHEDQFKPDASQRDELLTELAMKLEKWPDTIVGPQKVIRPGWAVAYGPRGLVYVELSAGAVNSISKSEWLDRRIELINEPDDNEAPERATHKAQDANGGWSFWYSKPDIFEDEDEEENGWCGKVGAPCAEYNTEHEEDLKGAIPAGHDWRTTLTEVNKLQYEPSDVAFSAESRLSDDRPQRDIDADKGKHYRREYKGIKLDPYRIAKIYDMQGGPREQIMKKCLRFTDKGQTEREVVAEIRTALARWEQMIEEDES